MELNEKICFRNHDKIVRLYKKFQTHQFKKNFLIHQKIFQEPFAQEIVLSYFDLNWKNISELVKLLKLLCSRLENNEFVCYLATYLNQINNTPDLLVLVNKILKKKNLYHHLKLILSILADQTKCLIYLRPDRISKKEIDFLIHLYSSDLNKLSQILFPNQKNPAKRIYLTLMAIKNYYPQPLMKLGIRYKPAKDRKFHKSNDIKKMFNRLFKLEGPQLDGTMLYILVQKGYLKKSEIETLLK